MVLLRLSIERVGIDIINYVTHAHVYNIYMYSMGLKLSGYYYFFISTYVRMYVPCRSSWPSLLLVLLEVPPLPLTQHVASTLQHTTEDYLRQLRDERRHQPHTWAGGMKCVWRLWIFHNFGYKLWYTIASHISIFLHMIASKTIYCKATFLCAWEIYANLSKRTSW